MQPTLCTRCKKRVAVVYISKIENGQTVNEGLCLKMRQGSGIAPGQRYDAPHGHH